MLNYRNTITGIIRLHIGNKQEPYLKISAIAKSIKDSGQPNALNILADNIRDYINALSLTNKKGWETELFTQIREYEVFDDWHNIDYQALAVPFWENANYPESLDTHL